MSDDQKEKNEKGAEHNQIQVQPLEIEKNEKDGQKAENVTIEKEAPTEEVAVEAPVEKDISPEEEKKIREEANKKSAKEKLAKIKEEMRPGDTVKVYTVVKEGDKERIQGFQGIIISKKGRGVSKTFMVRKIGAGGVGVERIWPIQSPNITKIDIVEQSKSRRAKLYYLRDRIGKAAV